MLTNRDQPIWLFWGWYQYFGQWWANSRYRYFQNFKIVFSASLSKIQCILCLTFFSKNLKNQDLWAKIFQIAAILTFDW